MLKTRWIPAIVVASALFFWEAEAQQVIPPDAIDPALDRAEGEVHADEDLPADRSEDQATTPSTNNSIQTEPAEGSEVVSDVPTSEDIARKNIEVQVSIAESSRKLANISMWQLLIAFVGTIALVATVGLNRRATKAAEDAVRDTRRFGKIQLEANLVISSFSMDFSPGRKRASCTFLNAGQTAATNVTSKVKFVAMCDGEGVFEEETRATHTNIVIGRDTAKTESYDFADLDGYQRIQEKIKQGREVRKAIEITVHYRTVFDEAVTKTFSCDADSYWTDEGFGEAFGFTSEYEAKFVLERRETQSRLV